MTSRSVRCPHCNHWLAELIDEHCAGRLRLRCGSCKRRWLLDLATLDIRPLLPLPAERAEKERVGGSET